MIELIVLDVDGTMTDGGIGYTANGVEYKTFNVKDGFAIVAWRKMGHHVAIITGRDSPIVTHRAKELGIVHCYQDVSDKGVVLEKIMADLGLSRSAVAAIGDDINDLPMLTRVAKSFAPSDAVAEVQNRVDVVVHAKGGEGAVREMIEFLLRDQGEYDAFLERYV
ncbi:MAG: 3-deoxy-D-manno-octulosonate 8-phosphate phosphatase [Sulfuricurvum sp. PC08-66]|nr:MAG: 3-deoxy-D-manno-octulosonate 8-phosphate phosphatase [Sulfuricurvum sp. PC08-66]